MRPVLFVITRGNIYVRLDLFAHPALIEILRKHRNRNKLYCLLMEAAAEALPSKIGGWEKSEARLCHGGSVTVQPVPPLILVWV